MACDVDARDGSSCGVRGKTNYTKKGPHSVRTMSASGRLPGFWSYKKWCSFGLSGMVVRLLLLVLLVLDLNLAAADQWNGLTILEKLIVGARCRARCNALYGYQERQRQIDLFDHYMPYTCSIGNDFNCLECSKVCLSESYSPVTCKQQCESAVCDDSCEFLHNAYLEESEIPGIPSVPAHNLTQAAGSLTLTQPKVICSYTDMRSLASDPKSSARIYWNVRDVTNVSTSLPLSFIIAIQNCSDVKKCPSSPTWHFFNNKTVTNFSVVPVYDLKPNSVYVIKVVAVHWSGYIPGSAESELIITPPVRDTLGTPVDVSISKQYVRAGNLHAVVSWKPPQYWGQLRYELKKLRFNSTYTIQVYNSDEAFLLYSRPANTTLHTLESCLDATDYDYNMCAPEKPNNVKLSSSVPYVINGTDQQLCDVTVTWDPPKYRRHRNFISNYTLSFRKAPDMYIADVIQPHRGSVTLPAWATNYTIRRCHWDGVYEVTMNAKSKGGTSLEVTVSITLGNGYADYYDSAEPDEEDKAVLYATLAPVFLGLLAVAVCLLYRWKIRTTKSLLVGESLRREEINPIYECAVSKEEAQLLVPDEYEISPDCLQFIEVIGEGAFGKVLRAEMDLSLAPIRGRSSGTMVVAVKVLKEHATPDERRNLLLEIEAMKQLGQHMNIVSILACVTCSQRPCLVMHYCPLGDLRTFLRNNRKKRAPKKDSSSTDTSSSSGRRGQLNSWDSGISYASKTSNSFRAQQVEQGRLPVSREETEGAVGGVAPLNPCLQKAATTVLCLPIATGRYCPKRSCCPSLDRLPWAWSIWQNGKFIHRDLAARNILLYNHRQVKISDFGLARDVYETFMYQPTSARKLPYKWMAIESIFDQVSTIKSDVWSFGIVLWEIVTLGGCPYPGIPNKDLFRLLKEGYRMEKPENCSLEIYKMMLSCWHPRPEDRPSFTELRNTLECSLEKSQSYIDLSVTVSEDYYKQDSEYSNNNSTPVGSARMSGDDCGGHGTLRTTNGHSVNSNTSISAAADVHVCQLFHNNSADKNLTLGLADSVTLEGPTSEAENSPGSSSPRESSKGAADNRRKRATVDGSAWSTPGCGNQGKTREKREGRGGEEETLCKERSQTFLLEEGTEEEEGVREAGDAERAKRQPQEGDGGRVEAGEGEEADGEGKDDDTFLTLTHRDGMHSEPLLPTSPRSASGSSSTELTCDCDSPYNLSDSSIASTGSSHAKVHHAPSLTYGVLSLLRTGKGSGLKKGRGRQRRQSQSLTDVSALEMTPELTPHSCAYERRTDGWACAL